MIRWEANFQIPNSGVQTKEVFVFVEDDLKTVKLYGDMQKTIQISEKQYNIPYGIDPYTYLLSLEEFKNYERV